VGKVGIFVPFEAEDAMMALLLTISCTDGTDTAGGDETDADTDADTDTDTDADSDTDSDTDTDTDPGADSDKDGYTADLDCDDADPAVHPDAKETCGNGQDDNCDGASNGCDWSGLVELDGIDLFDEDVEELAGREVAVCDLNGDDQLDVFLGAPFASAPFGSAGAVYGFFGPIVADTNTALADVILAGGVQGAWTAWALECSGDNDGDGLADLVVGAPGESARAGDVYLVPGGTTGAVEIADAALGHFSGEEDDDSLGTDVVTLDSNGDGLMDFAAAGGGNSYLWLGPASGVDTADVASARIYPGHGWSLWPVVGSAGDVDGDGDDELLQQATGPGGYTLEMFEGPLSGGMTSSDADATIADSGSYFGSMSAGIAHADLNADGLDDLIASNAGHDWYKGVSYVFFGDIDGDATTAVADAKIYGTTEGQWSGWAIAAPGDVDGDGNQDLALSAPIDSLGGKNNGAVFLFYGPFAGNMDVDADAQAEWYGGDYRGHAGWDLAAGDVTADRAVDLVVGVPLFEGGKAVVVSTWDL
jgi:hypothetical protein